MRFSSVPGGPPGRNPDAMRLIQVQRHPHGPRVYAAGVRVHHGPAGLAVAVLVRRRRVLAALALAWAATDWRDFPFRDIDNHRPKVRSLWNG